MFSFETLIFSILFLSIVSQIKFDLSCVDVKTNEFIINTLNGKVKGQCQDLSIFYADKTKNKDVAIMNWFSIPYAEPPIGKLRFSKPVPVKSWTNIRDGTTLPKQCIQLDNKAKSSEDCLFVNIYTPYTSYVKSVVQNDISAQLPIFIWIHGGSYLRESGAEYDTSMISATSNIVSITLNYRLGALGFLFLNSTNATGNVLFYDQSLAIKWVYENAVKFGGDKNRITIVGESAGSTSVAYHLLFKQSWPYFKNAILQSGNPVTDFADHYTPKQADSLTKKAASAIGCTKNTNQELLTCLQAVDAYQLNKITLNTIHLPIVVFDKDFINEQPKYLFQRGDFNKKANILQGFTNYEQLSLSEEEISKNEIDKLKNGDYSYFKTIVKQRLGISNTQLDKAIKYYVPTNQINNKQTDYFYYYVLMVTDYEYRCTTLYLLSEYLSAFNKNIYSYIYGHRSSLSKYPAKFDGAAHADELEMMYGEPLFDTNTYKSGEKLFSEQMISYWTNFVKYDKPSLNNEWLKYSETNSTINRNVFFLRINQNKNTIFKKTDEICTFWDGLSVFSED